MFRQRRSMGNKSQIDSKPQRPSVGGQNQGVRKNELKYPSNQNMLLI